jgi:D-arginine dehydrogenase
MNGFLKTFRRRGGRLHTKAEVSGISRNGRNWTLLAGGATYEAPILVNAAGAWADEVAALAGLPRIGLQPKRRSAAIIPAPCPELARWPQLGTISETFYCKPTGGKLMLSPCEATPVEPHDAWADDLKLAEAVEACQAAIDHEVTRLERTWGGLRTFAPDGDPVAGFDPVAEGFFWLAGQGGYGIQTSAAMARLAAALVLGRPVPPDIARKGVKASDLEPGRLKARS